MKNLVYLIIVLVSIASCKEEKAAAINNEKSVSEIKPSDRISSIVRNPITADDSAIDTINVARIEFEESSFNFGSVDAGDKVERVFKFKNTGKVNLLITKAKSTCGCTVPKWPEYPIAPGQSDQIKVVFDTKGKKGYQSKPVTIFANTTPRESKVYMKGQVIPGKEDE